MTYNKIDYITLDVFADGTYKHKEWVVNAICCSKYTHIIKYIVEEETEHYRKMMSNMIKEKMEL